MAFLCWGDYYYLGNFCWFFCVGVIIIFDEFFIRFTSSLIDFFIKIIDLFILFLEKLNDGSNFSNEKSSKEINFDKKEIFKFNNLREDSIFEEIGNKYSNKSSSVHSNSFNQHQNIFTSLNIENIENMDNGSSGENKRLVKKNFFENFKEKFIDSLINNSYIPIDESNIYNSILSLTLIMFSILTIIVALICYFISLEFGLAIFITFLLIAFTIFYYPKIKKQNDYSSFSKELPYALRQLATELRAGKSLFDSLDSIVYSDYDVLSLEFSRVLEEIKYGESTENAFLNLEKRIDSEALSRVIYEILTSLRVGANLSGSLTIIADDVNFDIRMKLKEYSEKLNAFIMIYTFLAILAPVIILTMLLAASVVIGDLVPGDLILVLYSVFFPMIILFLGFAIKKLEPKI